MTSTFPRAAAAATGLLTVAALCTGVAVAMTADPATPSAGARPLTAQEAAGSPAPAPSGTREPASAARSQDRAPLRESGSARDRRDRPGRPAAARHGAERPRHAPKTFAAQARRVLAVARAQRGKPYVWGAAGPRSFDCSGYVQWVYRRALGKRLPKFTDSQWAVLEHIKRRELRPGDLVFVGAGRQKSHVGIYAGHWKWWVAPRTGSHVKKQRIWPAPHTFARVVRTKR